MWSGERVVSEEAGGCEGEGSLDGAEREVDMTRFRGYIVHDPSDWIICM